MPTQVAVKNLSKIYCQRTGSIKALASINLSVAREEFACIIGPNGSGKSTLLKIMAGIDQPTTGTLKVAADTAYVPQQPSLLPWRTVAQNLKLPADIRGAAPGAAQADIEQWLKDFGLLEFADMYPAALSGGMQQKVALMRAALYSPSLLLLDEPFAALDAITRLELQAWLLELKHKTHATVVCVTHDIHEAVFLADTVYVLSDRPGHIRRKLAIKHPRAKGRRSRTTAYMQRAEATLAGLVVRTP